MFLFNHAVYTWYLVYDVFKYKKADLLNIIFNITLDTNIVGTYLLLLPNHYSVSTSWWIGWILQWLTILFKRLESHTITTYDPSGN